MPGQVVEAPLIRECLANIECKVVDFVSRHDIVVLEGVAAHLAASRRERRTLHAVGDGTFVVDGRTLNRRKRMAAKIPPGV
jgi:flavin reductase (DIM6/NTAB) family NADH-FMN oxidoreductase RutF